VAKCRTKRGKCAPVVQRATGGLLRRGRFPLLLQRQQARAMVPPPALCHAAFAQVPGSGAAVEAGPPAYEGKRKLSFSSASKQNPHAQDSSLEVMSCILAHRTQANQACGPDSAMQPWPQARDVHWRTPRCVCGQRLHGTQCGIHSKRRSADLRVAQAWHWPAGVGCWQLRWKLWRQGPAHDQRALPATASPAASAGIQRQIALIRGRRLALKHAWLLYSSCAAFVQQS